MFGGMVLDDEGAAVTVDELVVFVPQVRVVCVCVCCVKIKIE